MKSLRSAQTDSRLAPPSRAARQANPFRSHPTLAGPPAGRPQRGPRGPSWLLAGGVVVLAGVFLLYRGKFAESLSAPSVTDVPTVRVHTGDLERTITLAGSTIGENSTTLLAPYLRGSRARGGGGGFQLVLRELTSDGTWVKAGDTVATFDQVSMVQRVDDLKADRSLDEANLRSLAARQAADQETRNQQIRKAEGELDKAALDLQTAPVRSAIEAATLHLAVDEARAEYNQLLASTEAFDVSQRAQMRIAELELKRSDSEVSRAEANLERTVVRAPLDGIVVIRQTTRNNELATIRTGDELRRGQPFLDIVAPGPMIVNATVNQADVRRLRIGDSATVVPDAFPDLRLPAKVYSIGSIAVSGRFRANYVREVPVLLRIAATDPRMLPSLTAKAVVVSGRLDNVPLVSRTAVFSESPSGSPFALVQTEHGWEKRDLELGLANSTTVAVLSGLDAGETVATELPEDSEN